MAENTRVMIMTSAMSQPPMSGAAVAEDDAEVLEASAKSPCTSDGSDPFLMKLPDEPT